MGDSPEYPRPLSAHEAEVLGFMLEIDDSRKWLGHVTAAGAD